MSLDKQRTFTAIYSHFVLGNGNKSYDRSSNGNMCLYRSPDNNACFIGFLIPTDSEIETHIKQCNRESIVSIGLDAIKLSDQDPNILHRKIEISKFLGNGDLLTEEELNFLIELQNIHDKPNHHALNDDEIREEWRGLLNDFATEYKLTIPTSLPDTTRQAAALKRLHEKGIDINDPIDFIQKMEEMGKRIDALLAISEDALAVGAVNTYIDVLNQMEDMEEDLIACRILIPK